MKRTLITYLQSCVMMQCIISVEKVGIEALSKTLAEARDEMHHSLIALYSASPTGSQEPKTRRSQIMAMSYVLRLMQDHAGYTFDHESYTQWSIEETVEALEFNTFSFE